MTAHPAGPDPRLRPTGPDDPMSTAPDEPGGGPAASSARPQVPATGLARRAESTPAPADATRPAEPLWPVRGTAAGLGYVALPPTAVDARASGPTELIVAWPGFDPPRTAAAMATAVPMTGVPTWRVFLDLPHRDDPSSVLPTGLDSQGFLTDAGVTAFGASVEQAAALLPAVLDDLRRDLDVPVAPVALAGFSAGAAAVLLTLARQTVQVSTAALVAPVVSPARLAMSVEKRAGRERSWSPAADELAERLDFAVQVGRVAGAGAALLLIGGARDRIVPPAEVTALHDLLAHCGAPAVEAATFRMGHALAAAPGTEARAPITEAVRVDGVLTDWFRERLAEPTTPAAPPVSLHLTGSSSA
ncbi:alpha/beta hydrolase family protein [Actinomadura harenae]|uniref:Alpha/beta hydrolase n=1 Tax=Actinomadura harenae TaxID=2483351 RepID=A0A3M2L1U0_9ACTN|nr:hypothetical protein [Actinomadura harenae]RMI31551.1 hypothetical protein EBO15_42525 [Actinomadura harenae]